MSTRFLVTCALCAPVFASQALASGLNEYTLSESTTTYQQPAQQSFQTQPIYQPPAQQSFQTQSTYQPPVADTSNSQFGELVYDAQPYFPNGNTGSTESYTTDTSQSFTTDTFATQPYTGATDTVNYQPSYQATETVYQNAQPTYQPTQQSFQQAQPSYQPAQPIYQQPPAGAEDGSSWK